jgi:hypothetical protein
MNSNLHARIVVIAIVLIAICGAVALIYSTVWGLGTNSDSVGYIDAARNLLAGRGLGFLRASGNFRPLHLHPPLYPLLLSGAGFVGLDMLEAARWMNVALMMYLIVSMGLGFYLLTRRPFLSVLLGLLLLSNPILLYAFSGAYSEPLFYSMGIPGLLLLVSYLEDRRRWKLIGSAIATGITLLSRFTGAAYVGAGALGLFILSSQPIKRRVSETLGYLAISCLPILLWIAQLQIRYPGKNPGTYHLAVGNLWDELEPVRGALVVAMWRWMSFPSIIPLEKYLGRALFLALLVLLITAATIITLRKLRDDAEEKWWQNRTFRFLLLCMLFVLAYFTIYLFSYLFVEHPKPGPNTRLLSPIFFGLIFVYFAICGIVKGAWLSKRWIAIIFVSLPVASVLFNLPQSMDLISTMHQKGRGYTGKVWQDSDVIKALEGIPDDIPLISDTTSAILLYTERPAYEIPELWNKTVLENPKAFGEDVRDEAQRIFREDGAALVLFNSAYWQFNDLYGEKTPERFELFTQGLYKYYQGQDGAIYFYEEFQP